MHRTPQDSYIGVSQWEMTTQEKTGQQLKDLELRPRFKGIIPRHPLDNLNMPKPRSGRWNRAPTSIADQ